MTQRMTDIEAKASAARGLRRIRTGKPTIHMVDGRWVIYTGFKRLHPWEYHAFANWVAQKELRQRQEVWRTIQEKQKKVYTK